MERSETISGLVAALAKAQGEFPDISKSNTATVAMRENKGSYKYDYAPLDVVLKAVHPALAKNELAHNDVYEVRDGWLWLKATLYHGAEWIASALPLCPAERMPAEQILGSMTTYRRRYLVLGLLGIFPADDDDDGKAAHEYHAERATERAAKRPENGNGKTKPKAEPPKSEKPAETTTEHDRIERWKAKVFIAIAGAKDSLEAITEVWKKAEKVSEVPPAVRSEIANAIVKHVAKLQNATFGDASLSDDEKKARIDAMTEFCTSLTKAQEAALATA